MAVDRKLGAVFKRLETDEEFRGRLELAGASRWSIYDRCGAALDQYAWDQHRAQRRVIEAES